MTPSTFESLGLAEPVLAALKARGFTTPTPIQAAALPALMAGRDMLGLAQTGTGKTGAFCLPFLHRWAGEPHPAKAGVAALILAPTRELAVQIETELKAFSQKLKLRLALVLGGVSRNAQVANLRRGVDVIVATPGRLCDLMATGDVRLDQVRFFVLDEADRMLDMGFSRDIRRITAALPRERQTALFSATMPAEVTDLAHGMLRNPERVELVPREAATPARIDQRVYHVGPGEKRKLLEDLLADQALSRIIVFSRTKHGANKIVGQLRDAGFEADAIHGNKSQAARQKSLDRFRGGSARILVATDIAARGIDVPGVSHVINYDLPNEPESYVHRIGRTARAGLSGIAISFCDPSERAYLRAIERLTGQALAVAGGNINAHPETKPELRQQGRPQGGNRPKQQGAGSRAPAGRGRQGSRGFRSAA